jgi:hypothetical protein
MYYQEEYKKNNIDYNNLTYNFKLFNIDEEEYIQNKILDNEMNELKCVDKAYFQILIDKIIKERISINCKCTNDSKFIPNNYCSFGKLHIINQIPNKYLKKNILYYSLDEFIKYKPFFIL